MRTTKSTFKSSVFNGALALTLIAAATPALAQDRTYSIEPTSLSKALREYGRVSGRQLIFTENLVRGKRSPSLNGSYSPEAALAKLLEGSGLKATAAAGGALMIESTASGETHAGNAVAEIGSVDSASSTGQVTDSVTGAKLKGALVELEETGQTTSTDDLGTFRFPGLRPGNYRVRISYLGYRDIVSTIALGPNAQTRQFAMTGGSENYEIVVYGQRSARAQALNQERTAENVSTVVSSDMLGQFTGTTISEALRRAPGVAFQRNEESGEGTNIIVRGLEPDLNIVKLNGIELPVGDGLGRSADLGNILADSVDQVTISKTLLPSQDSGGTGGLVEIVTKGPLGRPTKYVNVVVEKGKRFNDFGDDLLLAGTVSTKIGTAQKFGISASIQYRKLQQSTFAYDHNLLFGQHFPLNDDGTPTITSLAHIDPSLPFPFEDSADGIFVTGTQGAFVDKDTTNIAATGSLEWEIGKHSNIRLDLLHSVAKAKTFGRSASFFDFSRYSLLPVASLGGEVRRALVWPGFMSAGQSYNLKEFKDVTNVATLRGSSTTGPIELKYALGFTKGTHSEPANVTLGMSNINSTFAPEHLASDAEDPVEGRIITLFGRRSGSGIQMPNLTQAGFEFLNDLNMYAFDGASRTSTAGSTKRKAGELSARYNFPGKHLRYIELGALYESTKFINSPGDNATISINDSPIAFGLAFDDTMLRRIGQDGGFSVLSAAAARDLLTTLNNLTSSEGSFDLSIVQQNELLRDSFTNEREIAGYIQSRFDINRLEIIGGVRLSNVEINARNLSFPRIFSVNFVPDVAFQVANTRLIDEEATQRSILPRILINYRYSDRLIGRLGYFLSVARPQIQQLSNLQRVILILAPVNGPGGNQPLLQVSQGNPNLKSARTNNFDASIEWYDRDVGVFKIGAFYKIIANSLQTNSNSSSDALDGIILPDDPRFETLPANIFVQVLRPENDSKPAKLWGIEAAFEKRFVSLPGLFGGLGVSANYTYSDSKKRVFRNWSAPIFNDQGSFIGRQTERKSFTVPFNQQPKHSGTMALTYNKYGVDAGLSYTRQSRVLTGYAGIQSVYLEPTDSLDFRAEYRFRLLGDSRIYVEGADLLKGKADPDLLRSRGGGVGNTPLAILGGNYLGGRRIKVGIVATF